MGVEVGLFLLFFSRRVGMGIFVRLLMLFPRKVLKLHAILSRFWFMKENLLVWVCFDQWE